MIIFCQSRDDCATSYIFVVLRANWHWLSRAYRDAPNLSTFRIVEMFTSCTEPSTKRQIITSFTSLTSPPWIVIATITFGMGVDCPNMHQIAHIGPPQDRELRSANRKRWSGWWTILCCAYSKKVTEKKAMSTYITTIHHADGTCCLQILKDIIVVSFHLPVCVVTHVPLNANVKHDDRRNKFCLLSL